jgi:hypothetical protein
LYQILALEAVKKITQIQVFEKKNHRNVEISRKATLVCTGKKKKHNISILDGYGVDK